MRLDVGGRSSGAGCPPQSSLLAHTLPFRGLRTTVTVPQKPSLLGDTALIPATITGRSAPARDGCSQAELALHQPEATHSAARQRALGRHRGAFL